MLHLSRLRRARPHAPNKTCGQLVVVGSVGPGGWDAVRTQAWLGCGVEFPVEEQTLVHATIVVLSVVVCVSALAAAAAAGVVGLWTRLRAGRLLSCCC